MLRPLQPADGPALAALNTASPDTGRFAVAPNYHIDPLEATQALDPDSVGIAATKSGVPGLLGAGFVQAGQCQVQGRLLPFGLLHSLIVHPAYRGQGIAQQLTEWRLKYTYEKLGDEHLKLALIQENNEPSLATARKWCKQLDGQLQTAVLPTRDKPVTQLSGVTVRPIHVTELEQVAQGLNCFYQEYELYTPETAISLATWLQQSPFSQPIRHYYAAVNKQGDLLAGLAVIEQCKVMTMHVTKMPGIVHGLNKLVRMVPKDGILRQLSISKLWFAPDQHQAASYLWETVRWHLREKGTHLVITFDPRSPVPKLVRLPFWLPRANFIVAAAGPVPIQFDRPLYPF